MKFIYVFIILLSSWKAFSYPWIQFKESKQQNYLEFDLQGSYFVTNEISVVSGMNLEYHNSKIDIDFGYRYSFLEEKGYFRFGELSVVLPLSSKLKMSLGFRDFIWSEADRYWNYGLWQPRYLLDPFRPVQTSLPGLYIDYLVGETAFTIYLSYFYLPDITSYPDTKNGLVFSKNPFFSNLYSSSKIDWNVKSFRSFDLESFLKPLYAFQIQHQLPQSEFSLSYAYKPMNQLQFLVQPESINLSKDKTNNLSIIGLDYSVSNHHLVTLESEAYLNQVVSIFASVFYEKPMKNKNIPEGWLSDDAESHITASALIYLKEEQGAFEKTIFSFGYTKTFESQTIQEASNFITEDLEQIFKRSFDFKHMFSASMEYSTRSVLSGLTFNFRVNYSLDSKIYLLAVDKSIYLTPSLQLYLSGDMLFNVASAGQEISDSKSTLYKYKDLSRALGGVKYVF